MNIYQRPLPVHTLRRINVEIIPKQYRRKQHAKYLYTVHFCCGVVESLACRRVCCKLSLHVIVLLRSYRWRHPRRLLRRCFCQTITQQTLVSGLKTSNIDETRENSTREKISISRFIFLTRREVKREAINRFWCLCNSFSMLRRVRNCQCYYYHYSLPVSHTADVCN